MVILYCIIDAITVFPTEAKVKNKPVHHGRSPSKNKNQNRSKNRKGKKRDSISIEVGLNMAKFSLPDVSNMTKVVAPNMSRRFKDSTVYAFPNFDRCDSLLYFPSTLARHLNSGDLSSVADLLSTHLDQNCTVHVLTNSSANICMAGLMELFELSNEFYPDSIMCMHSTKVVDNSICGKLYFKFTDNKAVFQALKPMTYNSIVGSLFHPVRSEHLKSVFRRKFKYEEEKILDAEGDIVVYGTVDLTLNFDANTRRVVDLKFFTELTSVVDPSSV